MSKKLLSLNVMTKTGKSFSFRIYDDPKHIPYWREQGLDVVQIYNTVPEWVVSAGLVRPWCFLQDVFNFKNPWRR